MRAGYGIAPELWPSRQFDVSSPTAGGDGVREEYAVSRNPETQVGLSPEILECEHAFHAHLFGLIFGGFLCCHNFA
jgi:hypothetical protein